MGKTLNEYLLKLINIKEQLEEILNDASNDSNKDSQLAAMIANSMQLAYLASYSKRNKK